MDHVLKKYCPRIEFDSYEDFAENFRIEVPEAFNFGFDVVDEWARVEPDKRALLWCNDAGEERTFTFTDIKRLSNQAANAFADMGIGKGDVVMCILRRRWEYWVCAVALCKLGATIIPASLQLTRKDVVYRANSADVRAIVAVNDDYVCTQVEQAMPDCPTVREKFIVDGSREGWVDFDDLIAGFPDTFERPTGEAAVTSKDIMLMYFTSGTTGNPKAVEHNFAHPLGHIITAKYWQQVREDKLHMSVTDSGWAKFGWGKIYGQWICGATIFAYDMDKFVPAKLLQKIQDYKLTTFCAPPTMYRFMLQEDVAAYDLSSVENFATAGEPLNAEVTIQWERLTGKKIREGFGQTEGPVLLATFPWVEPRPGSMGKPSPLLNVRLLDDEGREVEDGEEGAICVTGLKEAYPPGLFVGYYGNPEKTAEAVGGEYYNLHDMAWRDSDGYCFFVGRNDDVIKCSGYRIGPFEVESALVEHPAVVECAVTAAPDPIRGKVVKATVVLARGYEGTDALTRELQEHVKKTTAPYKYPRIIEYVDELPKTIGGKIKRKLIRTNDGIEE
ncbi:AMP-binding protein [Adlercreutzia muris]|uniref:AMP-binding protein n=1 Tax=Adlercreutzia muris TaxID=1796610 RepID=A0A7C8FXA6_9ACTN|nr:AMP-binding protein [Adlercreutzia muris]KAB1650795.1 AMP-binding protein [Adlercreutzia muris]MCR2027254.1 AMP-binding protein [Adlercreutzia muris]MCU7585287.1 AMP-binding protein [Adlercreutzia muris]TGY73911.1 acetyl-CoA synthetase [Enterorhabdus sp. NM05_H27]